MKNSHQHRIASESEAPKRPQAETAAELDAQLPAIPERGALNVPAPPAT